MSKDFEEAVLKKLDATDKVIQEVVLKKLDATDKVIQEVVLKKLEKLDELEEKMNDTNKVVREIKQDFAKFDYEINIKIDTLFDANKANNQKHDFYEQNISSLNAKVFNYDLRISNLEDKVLTA